jgi:acid phosphatase
MDASMPPGLGWRRTPEIDPRRIADALAPDGVPMRLAKPFRPFSTAVAALLVAGSAFAGTVPMPDHIVVVIEENHDYDQIIGNAAAPFINGSVVAGGLLYTNSHATQHPSQPNYLDLFSGSTQGVNSANASLSNPYNLPAQLAYLQSLPNPTPTQLQQIATLKFYVAYLGPQANVGGDAFPKASNFLTPVSAPFTTPNLAAALRDNGKTFVEYSDGLAKIPGAVDANGNAVPSVINNPADPYSVGYAHRHDPVANWMTDSPVGNQLANTTEQDFGNFGKNGFDSLPTVSFIVPDTVHDMHDGAIPASTTVGDTWLKNNLGSYLDWAKTHNSLLIVTTDENDYIDPSNKIATIINGDARLFQAGTSDQLINHFDLLRTLQEVNGVPAGQFAGASATAAGLAFAGGVFTATTPVPEAQTVAMMLAGLGLLAAGRRRNRG